MILLSLNYLDMKKVLLRALLKKEKAGLNRRMAALFS